MGEQQKTDEAEASVDLLNNGMDRGEVSRQRGAIKAVLRTYFEEHDGEIEESYDRFKTAINEGWEIVFGVATSGAHGWQIVTDHESDDRLVASDEYGADPDAPNRLADAADPTDLQWLVFANGWIFHYRCEWLEGDHVVEIVENRLDRIRTAAERASDDEDEWMDELDSLVPVRDYAGRVMSEYARHEPTGVKGGKRDVVNFALGYREGREDEEGL